MKLHGVKRKLAVVTATIALAAGAIVGAGVVAPDTAELASPGGGIPDGTATMPADDCEEGETSCGVIIRMSLDGPSLGTLGSK